MKVYDENGNFIGNLEVPKSEPKFLRAFKTRFAIPDHDEGTVFVHDPGDSVRGNIGNGSLRLAWVNGNCQNNWGAGAVVFPGQYARKDYSLYFTEIHNDGRYT